jgi:ATP-binding cassette subfamily B protein
MPGIPNTAASQHALDHRFSGEHPLRTLLFPYRGQRSRVVAATALFGIKHSPMWLMPAITAHVIALVTRGSETARRYPTLAAVVSVIVLVQNVPLHFAFVRSLRLAARTMETQLRSALCRRRQI